MDENNKEWIDTSWGNIDPGQAYRYYLKDDTERYIDLFFYDGAISKSVAFESILQDGEHFIVDLKMDFAGQETITSLVHIATDGESYGHHTKFGEMALCLYIKEKIG